MDPSELASTLANEGGFSISAAGRSAHSGTMVSRAGTEEARAGIANPTQIADYQSRHAQEFQRRGRYFGAWVENKPGNPNLRPGSPVARRETVFDVSQRIPSGHADAANLQAHIHGQRAVFDVDRGDVKETTPVLPMDYSHMDLETIHSPQIRNASQIFGESSRRGNAQQMMQPELPFSAGARRRLGMF